MCFMQEAIGCSSANARLGGQQVLKNICEHMNMMEMQSMTNGKQIKDK